ncbi:hypothetical protein H6P81_010699 [Aristolochia fimbriata]|uniref:Uncharacterized protein n=1 Tax=Aristolochia fimbriata TaxID=158543 RepID=A0AAV7EQ65_ARIFI|nr:hypothetical protein H6P81_010699 [Aristolochia fimbriata]
MPSRTSLPCKHVNLLSIIKPLLSCPPITIIPWSVITVSDAQKLQCFGWFMAPKVDLTPQHLNGNVLFSEASNGASSQMPPKPRNHRGPTRETSLDPPKDQKWKCIIHNNQMSQGDTLKVTQKLGVYARNGNYFPLHLQWGELATMKSAVVFSELKKKIDFVNEEGVEVKDEVAIVACQEILKKGITNWRAKLKKKYYDGKKDEDCKTCPDKRVMQSQWDSLILYWKEEANVIVAQKNKENRAKAQASHTLGSKSIAKHYFEEHEKNKENFRVHDAYLSYHKKKNGEYANDYTRVKCLEVSNTFQKNEIVESQDTRDLSIVLDKVYGRHHGGYERGLGTGWSRRREKIVVSSSEKVNTLSTQLEQAHEEITALKERERERDERERQSAEQMQWLKDQVLHLTQRITSQGATSQGLSNDVRMTRDYMEHAKIFWGKSLFWKFFTQVTYSDTILCTIRLRRRKFKLHECASSSSPVVMLGLDAAGKTTILYKLHIGEVLSTVPTIGEISPLLPASCQDILLSYIVSGDCIQVLGSLSMLATLLQTKELDESMLDALGILPQRKQHKKFLVVGAYLF